MKILADPQDEEYEYHVWAASMKGLRGKFDPEAFDAGGEVRQSEAAAQKNVQRNRLVGFCEAQDLRSISFSQFLQATAMSAHPDPPEILGEQALEHGVWRRDCCEQRGARAQLHVIRGTKDFFR